MRFLWFVLDLLFVTLLFRFILMLLLLRRIVGLSRIMVRIWRLLLGCRG